MAFFGADWNEGGNWWEREDDAKQISKLKEQNQELADAAQKYIDSVIRREHLSDHRIREKLEDLIRLIGETNGQR